MSVTTIEPFWRIAEEAAAVGAWTRLGDAQSIYLVHDAPYDRFGFGPRMLAAARAIGDAEIREHTDREGEVAFYSVRIPAPHRLRVQRAGIFIDRL